MLTEDVSLLVRVTTFVGSLRQLTCSAVSLRDQVLSELADGPMTAGVCSIKLRSIHDLSVEANPA